MPRVTFLRVALVSMEAAKNAFDSTVGDNGRLEAQSSEEYNMSICDAGECRQKLNHYRATKIILKIVAVCCAVTA
jgi:hypothetical protein